jgi:decaprenylphospho-beta-D-ribofuranose 2-oxidase
MMKTVRRVLLAFLVLASCGIAVILIAPLFHETASTEPPNVINDVARLNPTVVREVIQPTTEDEIRDAILKAVAAGAKVTIGGKRHSMGGQTLYADSISLDMQRFNRILSLDETNKVLVVQSGATWSDIQQFLNPHGLAVLVMQSPNVFTVGGSMSVNAHGWDMRHGTVGASVEWFRILLADGSIRRCSHEENPELFHLVVGGYGLFGVILDVALHVTDNSGYEAIVCDLDYSQLPMFFENQLSDHPDVELGEADLSISPTHESFLREAVAVAYKRKDGNQRRTDPLLAEQHIFRDSYFFNLSRQYDWGKTVRWALQKRLEYPSEGEVRTRNNIFRSPIQRIRHYSPTDTDILQEYFIPPYSFPAFVNGLREAVKTRQINLLSATVRYIEWDEEAFLEYSKRPKLAIVLYMNVKTSSEGQVTAQSFTNQLISLAVKEGGTFYLPYVLYYDKAHLLAAYPMANDFFAAKKRYDPAELFTNDFYAKYSH